jgi:hypothetical protein
VEFSFAKEEEIRQRKLKILLDYDDGNIFQESNARNIPRENLQTFHFINNVCLPICY